jgi:hypothetical protein
MNLTQEQKKQLADWVREGLSLSDIQKNLQSEFDLLITYMDLRFLVDDLDLSMPDKPSAHFTEDLKADAKASGPDAATKDSQLAGDGDVLDADDNAGGGLPVQVTLDRVTRPGALISGTVSFSDGVKAQWHLDQTGRLALQPPSPGYQPSQEDVVQFQQELQRLVEQQGAF